MQNVFLGAGSSVETLICFQQSHGRDGVRAYSTPLETKSYETYNDNKNYGRIVLISDFVDGANLSKSDTQSVTFLRVRFSNMKCLSDKWYDIFIDPSGKVFQSTCERKENSQNRCSCFSDSYF